MPRCRPLLPRDGAPQATRARRRGLEEASRAARLRRQRRPIAIAAALNDHRGVRRGLLPRGLCNTCPDAARARDHLRARASVTQALTDSVGRQVRQRSFKAELGPYALERPLMAVQRKLVVAAGERPLSVGAAARRYTADVWDQSSDRALARRTRRPAPGRHFQFAAAPGS